MFRSELNPNLNWWPNLLPLGNFRRKISLSTIAMGSQSSVDSKVIPLQFRKTNKNWRRTNFRGGDCKASDGSIDAIGDVNWATTNGFRGDCYMELQSLKLATVEPKVQHGGYSKDWFEPARNFPQVMCIEELKPELVNSDNNPRS